MSAPSPDAQGRVSRFTTLNGASLSMTRFNCTHARVATFVTRTTTLSPTSSAAIRQFRPMFVRRTSLSLNTTLGASFCSCDTTASCFNEMTAGLSRSSTTMHIVAFVTAKHNGSLSQELEMISVNTHTQINVYCHKLLNLFQWYKPKFCQQGYIPQA
eukprot:m.109345 g.109345  ORF g.109345 m.109345 type:complete len:157 (+) comp13375_c0_seq2:2660-3130(+)